MTTTPKADTVTRQTTAHERNRFRARLPYLVLAKLAHEADDDKSWATLAAFANHEEAERYIAERLARYLDSQVVYRLLTVTP